MYWIEFQYRKHTPQAKLVGTKTQLVRFENAEDAQAHFEFLHYDTDIIQNLKMYFKEETC